MFTAKDFRPNLLISGVTERRSDSPRERQLTERLVRGITGVADEEWNTQISWGVAEGKEGALERLAGADAVVIMGGPDVSPIYYGGSAVYPHQETHFPRADEAQIALVEAAIVRGIPLVGICRGMQILNVGCGGTLIQHISEPGHSNPRLLDKFRFSRHMVQLNLESRLGEALGSLSTEGRMLVHSAHHQAVESLGAGLSVSAWAPDGTIEAVEHDSAPICGVQWHPEDPDADPAGLRMLLARMRENCCLHMAA